MSDDIQWPQSCRVFELDEILLATQNFNDSLVVGTGGFGKVYKGDVVIGSSRVVAAIKRLDLKSSQGAEEFWAEVKMLSKLRHTHLVSLIGYCNYESEMILVYEYMPKGTLEDHLHKFRTNLSWLELLKICIGAARGLDYLHTGTGDEFGVIHRDVKTSNILLHDNWSAKVSDFGLSRIGPTNQPVTYVNTLVKGTFGYLDPNYFATGKLTRKSDVYAFGVVLFEVLCQKRPLDKSLEYGLATWVLDSIKQGDLKDIIHSKIKGEISPKCLKQFSQIAERCLDNHPKHRPTMTEVVFSLESVLALQQKTNNMLQTSGKSIFGRMVDMLPFGSAGENAALPLKNGYSSTEDFLKEFYIPDYVLVPGRKVEVLSAAPACPMLVFINSKSDGQLGRQLLVTYRSVLNKNQVFDLDEVVPEKVLCELYLTLKHLELSGDELAIKIQKQLRVIVAGGDGTAAWLLGIVSDLKLSYPPPIATAPLGTVNNLPFAFGWGMKNPGTDHESVLKFLELVLDGKEMEIDSWHILMRMKSIGRGYMNIPPLELPHSLHAFSSSSDKDILNMSGYNTFCGGFWTYFSMGAEPQVSYTFHSERKLHPENFKNQLDNQSTYAKIDSRRGVYASLSQPSSKNIAQLVKVKIMQRNGEWKDLKLPESIKSILCINLPSVSGGLNPWGTPNRKISIDRDFTSPYVDDGRIEIVGLRDAWRGLVLGGPKGNGIRLAQTNRVRFEFYKGVAESTYMQMDGEPWEQPLPHDDGTTIVEISHLGRVKMVATQNCILHSMYDPATSRSHEEASDDSENEDAPRGEEWRKFGEAETLKIPEDEEILRPS